MAADAFASIAGQDQAVDVLRRAVAAGRVAHAYAFVGPAGSGRMAAAVALAKAVAAANPGAAARVDRGVHPDVRVFSPTPPDKNPKGPLALRIEDVRELERLAALRPAEAGAKVFIVDGADRMTGAAPQALLKTLEEPPADTVIVLILTQLRALPPTVLSRCQVIRFRPRPVEGAPALLPGARSDAHRAALEALERSCARGAEGILDVGEQVGRDRAGAETFVETCWLHYRDLLCRASGAPDRLTVFQGQSEAAPRALHDVLRGLAACREAWYGLEGNVSPRLTVEVLLSRLDPSRAQA